MGASGRAGTLSLIALLTIAVPVGAEDDPAEPPRKNTVELFLGAVKEVEPSSTGGGVGLEYNRRLARKWTLGIELVEISSNELRRSWLVVVPAYFHPIEGLNLKAGLGIERAVELPVEEPPEKESEAVLRLGVGWEFEVSRSFRVTPEVNADLVGGETTWVYGVSLGFAF